jgi:hypothetical protein
MVNYICPGCLFYGTNVLIKNFTCNICSDKLRSESDDSKKLIYKCFSYHSKQGRRCQSCSRFIPESHAKNNYAICPYSDCTYAGSYDILNKMHHPSTRIIISNNDSTKLDDDPEILDIRKTIESLYSTILYSSSNFTVKRKQAAYRAFLNLLDEQPVKMTSYLLPGNKKNHSGIQNLLFKKFISILENDLPFSYKKGKSIVTINSLLDPDLNIFDGISKFDSTITDKLEIINNTNEFYIGGRKATYSKPYYIGKLLDIINLSDSKSLLNNVISYNFNKIKMKNIAPNTNIRVIHLRVPPHYQMGAMVYINRARKSIIDSQIKILNEK